MKSSTEDFASWAPPDLDFPGRPDPPPMPAALLTLGDEALRLPSFEELPSEPTPLEAGTGSVRTALEEAYARGADDGRLLGAADTEAKVHGVTELLRHATDALREARDDFSINRVRNVHALAIAVAAHVIQREVKADPEIMATLTERAVKAAGDDDLEVRLHPDDLAAIQGELTRIAPPDGPPVVRWVPDATITRGGVRVEGPRRIVDGRTETALRQLYERLEHD
ncbi:MAG: FliH/SctL family protein [Candidatus Eisenbacteria bacterium]